MSIKGKVMVAMSGGLDSAISAVLLAEKGYEVIGITMKTWEYATSGGKKKETGCCNLDSVNDARTLAVNEGFPHYIVDIRKEFEEQVVTDFVNEYFAGRTPNPCILCNTKIKWGTLIEKADKLDCEYIATGHYAQIKQEGGRYILSKGVDETKDQSYVLWGLNQENLKRTIFPLGNKTKRQVREIAKRRGYFDLLSKSESYEICFVPDNNYRDFLRRRDNNKDKKVDEGHFVSTTGEVLGTHKGYPFYTIGQRKGLEVAFGEPMYVTKIIPESNTIVLGKEDELKKKQIIVDHINSIKYVEIPEGLNVTTKVRYHDKGNESKLFHDNNRIKVTFSNNTKSIAPGQSAVFYEGNDVVGGGVII